MITQSVAQLLEDRVTLTLEGIDRLYLNAYQPMLQTGAVLQPTCAGYESGEGQPASLVPGNAASNEAASLHLSYIVGEGV